MRVKLILFLTALFFVAFTSTVKETTESPLQKKVDEFAEFKLESNIEDLSDNQKEMLIIFFEVAEIMDNLFWQQSFGSKKEALALTDDPAGKQFIKLNYGPWERLDGNAPFIEGVTEKPLGAQYYPLDMTKEEFEKFESEDKTSLYTVVVRDENGELKTVPFSEAYKAELEKAAELLKKAAELAEDAGFKKYLELEPVNSNREKIELWLAKYGTK